jgi:hypothetical protein
VRVEERRLHPELVAGVTDRSSTGDYVDVEFTARMVRSRRDRPRRTRVGTALRAFTGRVRDRVDEKRRELKRSDFTTEATDEVCSRVPDGHRLGRTVGSWPA